jgi:hypothetical protein
MNTNANKTENLWEQESIVTEEEIKERLFIINNENFKNPNCIDWRDENEEKPSIPWWKIWVLIAVMKTLDDLQFSKEKKEKVVECLRNYFGWFSFHSDTNVEKQHDCKWCWHIKYSLFESIEDYQLSDQSLEIIKKVIWEVKKTEVDILKWAHEEKAVIIVESEVHWVKSQEGWKQFFVYNLWYAKKLYNDISNKIEKEWILEWINNLWDHFFKSWDKQFLITWLKLAKGLPIYELKISSDWTIESIEQVWVVGTDPTKKKVEKILEKK